MSRIISKIVGSNNEEGPKVRLLTVEPSTAAELLKMNSRNRPLKKGKILEYAGQMKRGEWDDAIADIDIDREGVLINGQNTLHAVISSGTSIVVTLKTGLSPKSQDVLDTQTKRTVGDQLAIEGFVHANVVASTARIVLPWRDKGELKVGQNNKTGINPSNTSYDRRELLDFCRRNQGELERNATLAQTRNKASGALLTPTFIAVLQIVFGDSAPEHGQAFLRQLFLEEQPCAQPVAAYRTRLLSLRGQTAEWTMSMKFLYAIKAFNAYMAREEIRKFTMKPNENVQIIVPEGVN